MKRQQPSHLKSLWGLKANMTYLRSGESLNLPRRMMSVDVVFQTQCTPHSLMIDMSLCMIYYECFHKQKSLTLGYFQVESLIFLQIP